jgi:ribonuclease G
MGAKIVANVSPNETRIANIKSDQVVDIYVERPTDRGVVGNIYKGKVVRVLPGMQAAFLDIGLERTAFLYVGDIHVPKEKFEEEPDEDEEKDHEDDDADSDEFFRKPLPSELPKIQDLLREGQDILVQVAKAPIGTKGARLTTHITLAGRHLVYMPTVEHIGISRKIRDVEERKRLRDAIDKSKPAEGGVIVRTAGEGKGTKKLKNDISFLSRVWRDIKLREKKAKAPSCIYEDLDLVFRIVRDQFTEDVEEFVIDDDDEFKRVSQFVEKYLPLQKKQLIHYSGATPIFDHYGVEMEIQRALGRKVWLKSGGYIIVDQMEALTAVDVNTGRFVGRGNLEDTILKTNLEAVKEIAYQLRLRNIGGIIVLDFIDMERESHRERVMTLLREELKKDKSKTNVLRISELGLVEMTRKRVRESLNRLLCEPCPYCDGKGHVRSKETICNEIDREVIREHSQAKSETIVVYCHPKIASILMENEHHRVVNLEKKLSVRLHIKADPTFHLEQYEVFAR